MVWSQSFRMTSKQGVSVVVEFPIFLVGPLFDVYKRNSRSKHLCHPVIRLDVGRRFVEPQRNFYVDKEPA
jgi:hypothetical protein